MRARRLPQDGWPDCSLDEVAANADDKLVTLCFARVRGQDPTEMLFAEGDDLVPPFSTEGAHEAPHARIGQGDCGAIGIFSMPMPLPRRRNASP